MPKFRNEQSKGCESCLDGKLEECPNCKYKDCYCSEPVSCTTAICKACLELEPFHRRVLDVNTDDEVKSWGPVHFFPFDSTDVKLEMLRTIIKKIEALERKMDHLLSGAGIHDNYEAP